MCAYIIIIYIHDIVYKTTQMRIGVKGRGWAEEGRGKGGGQGRVERRRGKEAEEASNHEVGEEQATIAEEASDREETVAGEHSGEEEASDREETLASKPLLTVAWQSNQSNLGNLGKLWPAT